MAKEITVAVPEGKSAQWINGVLTLVDDVEAKKDDRPVTERIKTFEDAVNELGKDHPFVTLYHSFISELPENDESLLSESDVIAYLKLRIITAALNEGWSPEFKEGEWRYAPYFELYTLKEIDEMSEDEKNDKRLCLVGGSAFHGLSCGLACVDSYDAFSYADASIGSRLAYRTSELAKYSGKQFCEIWKDMIFEKR